MYLDYLPLSFDKVDNFFEETGYNSRICQEEILLDLIDNRFCKYIVDDGCNGYICGKKSKNIIIQGYCDDHIKFLYPDLYKKNKKRYYMKKSKEDIFYCNSKNKRNENCTRKVKNKGSICGIHFRKINNNINKFILIYFIYCYYIFIVYLLINFINILKKYNYIKEKREKRNDKYYFPKTNIYNIKIIDREYKDTYIKLYYGKISTFNFGNFKKCINNCVYPAHMYGICIKCLQEPLGDEISNKNDVNFDIIQTKVNEIRKIKNIKKNLISKFYENNRLLLKKENIDKEEIDFLIKNGVKIYNEDKDLLNYIKMYDIKNGKRVDVDKLIKYYKDISKIKAYIKTNKKYIYRNLNKGKCKYYYSEYDIYNLIDSIKLRYEILIEDFSNSDKNSEYLHYILYEYKKDIDASIEEFYEIDDEYKLYC